MANTLHFVLVAGISLVLASCFGGYAGLSLITTTEPNYPESALKQGIEGYVVVEYNINAEGRVVHPKVIEAAPDGVFEIAAIQAVSLWQFRTTHDLPQQGVRSKITFAIGDKEYP